MAYGKASLFDAEVSADANILPANLTAVRPPAIFRVYIVVDTPAKLKVIRKVGDDDVDEVLNNDTALNANCSYMFDIIVDDKEEINFQLSGEELSEGATILKLSVIEVGGDS